MFIHWGYCSINGRPQSVLGFPQDESEAVRGRDPSKKRQVKRLVNIVVNIVVTSGKYGKS